MNWQGQDIKKLDDIKLKALQAHLTAMASERASTQHNVRTAKLKNINFNQSQNSYFNGLKVAVDAEMKSRGL